MRIADVERDKQSSQSILVSWRFPNLCDGTGGGFEGAYQLLLFTDDKYSELADKLE